MCTFIPFPPCNPDCARFRARAKINISRGNQLTCSLGGEARVIREKRTSLAAL